MGSESARNIIVCTLIVTLPADVIYICLAFKINYVDVDA